MSDVEHLGLDSATPTTGKTENTVKSKDSWLYNVGTEKGGVIGRCPAGFGSPPVHRLEGVGTPVTNLRDQGPKDVKAAAKSAGVRTVASQPVGAASSSTTATAKRPAKNEKSWSPTDQDSYFYC